jgi:hypothetical protein
MGVEKLTAKVEVDVLNRDLIGILVGVIEANTGAMERVTSAVEANAKMIADNVKKNAELSQGMRHLVGSIRGAQRLIGEEVGAVIDKSKETQARLIVELEAARADGDQEKVDRLSRVQRAAAENTPPSPGGTHA